MNDLLRLDVTFSIEAAISPLSDEEISFIYI